MPRSIEEWIGRNDDDPPPPRVRVRVFARCKGKCGICGRKLSAGDKWTCEHVVALINRGENRENNLGVTCSWCLPGKNARDVKEKSRIYKKQRKHLGVKHKGRRPMPGTKASGWRKPMYGKWEQR